MVSLIFLFFSASHKQPLLAGSCHCLYFGTSGRIDPVRINILLEDFKCGSFFTLMGLQRSVSPSSLTSIELLNGAIKGCYRESMKAARWQQFPPLWLRLYQNGFYASDKVFLVFLWRLRSDSLLDVFSGLIWSYGPYPHTAAPQHVWNIRLTYQPQSLKIKSTATLVSSHLLSVIKHSQEEHGHQEQRCLLGPQKVSVGTKQRKKQLPVDFMWRKV